MSTRIHPTAEVSSSAQIGHGTSVWHYAQIREGVHLGRECTVGKGVYIDAGVRIGDRVKIQNGANIYRHATLGDGAFVGPGVCLTNDRFPRAVMPDGTLKTDNNWEVGHTEVGEGAALGAGSIILPDTVIGAWAMVGSGSVVTRDVPAHGVVYGNPATLRGVACRCGHVVRGSYEELIAGSCPACGACYLHPMKEGDE